MLKALSAIIYQKQEKMDSVPPNAEMTGWALSLLELLFPEQKNQLFKSPEAIEVQFHAFEIALVSLLNRTKACDDCNQEQVAREFFAALPELYRMLETDIAALCEGDPAAQNEFEVVRSYPGFFAISMYRMAKALLELSVPVIPRILTEFAHSKTGIDIHPGASIGESMYIDHGTGIVIGESTRIGHHVKIYQGVTLGALSVTKSMAHAKRHPTIEDHVVLYAGATILGGQTTIGHHSVIGGNVWLTASVPPHSKVYHIAEIHVDAL